MSESKLIRVSTYARRHNLSVQAVYNKIAKGEKVWSKRGYDVVNPIKLCKQEWSWLHCMIVCLWHLIQCRFVYFMPNYKFSRGSKIELKVAQFLNKMIFIDN